MIKILFFFCFFITFNKIYSNNIIDISETVLFLQEYLDISVVSASRRLQKLSDAPLTISVITQEEILSMGVNSIPEVLRMVPGVFVQNITGGQYEVGIRGLLNVPPTNSTFSAYSTNILVLIDGRSFFNDSFGGTFWEFLPVTINDIERIEIIRGPASAMFGANAVSGVINIITRNRDTVENKILCVSNSYGSKSQNHRFYFASNFDKLFLSFSAEKSIKKRYNYEEYDITKKEFTQGRGLTLGGFDLNPPASVNSIDSYKGLFTLNYHFDKNNSIDFKLGLSDGHHNFFGGTSDFLIYKTYLSNEFAKISYETKISDHTLNVNYSRLKIMIGENDDDIYVYNNKQNGMSTISDDIEIRGIFNLIPNNIFVAGFNHRKNIVRSDGLYFNREPDRKKQSFTSFYFNNQYSLIQDKINFTTALRIDKYSVPNITEYSPHISFLYKYNNNNIFKINYSESIRTPFVSELYLSSYGTPTEFFNLYYLGMKNIILWQGNKNLMPPRIKSYELSYLNKPTLNSNLEISLFQNIIQDLISFDLIFDNPFSLSDFAPAVKAGFINISEKYKTYGAELNYRWNINNYCSMWSNLTFQTMKFDSKRVFFTPETIANAGISTRFFRNLQLNFFVNYSSKTVIPLQNNIDRNVDLIMLDDNNISNSNLSHNPLYNDIYDLASNLFVYDSSAWIENFVANNILTESQGNKILDFEDKHELLSIFHSSEILNSDFEIESLKAQQLLKDLSNGFLVTSLYHITKDNVADGKTSDNITFNANISYDVNDKMNISFTGLNIFNRKYRSYAYGEKFGASYYATVKVRF